MRLRTSDKLGAEISVLDICRTTRWRYSAEEKNRIVLVGLRGEAWALKETLAELLMENRLLKTQDLPDHQSGVYPDAGLRQVPATHIHG